MGPQGVAGGGALTVTDRGPQVGGVAEPTRAQLQADEGRERLLGRTARGTSATHGLRERGGRRHVGGRLRDDLVDPALDEREQRLEPLERLLLLGGALRLEQPALQGLGDLLRTGGVELADLRLDRVDVDAGVAAELVDGADERLLEPRGVGEQPVVGRLAQDDVEQHVGRGDLEALTELGDVVGEDGDRAGRAHGQADVGGRHDLRGELGERLTDLLGEHRAAGLVEHAEQGPGEGLRLLGDGLAHGADDVVGDGLDETVPRGARALDPLRAAPRRGGGGCDRHLRDAVEPGLRETGRVGDRADLARVRRRIGTPRGDDLAGDVLGGAEVDRAVRRGAAEHLLHLAEEGAEVGDLAAGASGCAAAERGEHLLERRAGERIGLLAAVVVVAVAVCGVIGHASSLSRPNQCPRRPDDPDRRPSRRGPGRRRGTRPRVGG